MPNGRETPQDIIIRTRNECADLRRNVDAAIAQRDRLAEALQNLLANWPTGLVSKRQQAAIATAQAALAAVEAE